MRKLKVGDEVEVVGSGDKYGYTKDGSRGIIKTVSNDFCFIRFSKFTGGEPSYGTSFNIDTKCLKLVEAKGKYKIGDMVTVINDGDYYYEQTGKVTEVRKKGRLYPYRVSFNRGQDYGNVFTGNDIEPLTFREGDEVGLAEEVSVMFNAQSNGHSGVISSDAMSTDWMNVTWSHGETWAYPLKDLVKLKPGGKKMTKYDELKQRIEILGNGWTEEADNILSEIHLEGSSNHWLCISTMNTSMHSYVKIFKSRDGREVAKFEYNGQCEKMAAFKKALIWLLDNSAIKDEKADKINELEDRMDVIRDEIRELKG